MHDRSLADSVLVVTGAGGGIGREIALLAAAEGARVLVNDFGGASDGTGSDPSPAQSVADEIRAAGGEAIANATDVSADGAGEEIIGAALTAFGRIDAVVNNAGILRDRIFHQLPPEDFDRVLKVHLYGSFGVARAAAPHFRAQSSGAFVHMTSTSALIGNLGQANYAAAKLGIVGLSKAIALDMTRFGVRSNCIAPFAWSRLVGTIPATSESEADRVAMMQRLAPATIAPLAVFLASGLSSDISGQIFSVRANEIFLFSQPRPIRSVHRSEGWTPVTLHEHMQPALAKSFYPLERTIDVINWQPI